MIIIDEGKVVIEGEPVDVHCELLVGITSVLSMLHDKSTEWCNCCIDDIMQMLAGYKAGMKLNLEPKECLSKSIELFYKERCID